MRAPETIEKLHEESELFDPEILKAFTKVWEIGLITQKAILKPDKPIVTEWFSGPFRILPKDSHFQNLTHSRHLEL